MQTPGDLSRIAFRRVDRKTWSFLWKDYIGFASCAALGACASLWMKYDSLDRSPHYEILVTLSAGAFLVGLIGLFRAALRRQFAPISLLSAGASLLPIWFLFILGAMALQR
jgi:hypothetical protein